MGSCQEGEQYTYFAVYVVLKISKREKMKSSLPDS